MVEWKNNIQKQNSGKKAAQLDQINNLEVPNFFVITKQETRQITKQKTQPRKILNQEIPSRQKEKIKSAYKEIGMSSEVRNASGKAKNLVGGQRENQRVSIRISNSKPGTTQHKLDVGSSNLFKELKQVIASFYKTEQQDKYPAIIIQKMIEPEVTGTLVKNYTQKHDLIETVQGLGNTLENANTTPDFHLTQNKSIQQSHIPSTQKKTTRHPLNGNQTTKQIQKQKTNLSQQKIKELLEKTQNQQKSIKFAYKRNTFYITDVFENKPIKYNERVDISRKIKLTPGEIKESEKSLFKTTKSLKEPENYQKGIITQKASYVSQKTQKARQQNKIVVIDPEMNQQQNKKTEKQNQKREEQKEPEENISRKPTNKEETQEIITATEILPINEGEKAVNTKPPFTKGYSITELENIKGNLIPRKNYITSYGEIFANKEKEKIVIDARKLEKTGLKQSLSYPNSETKIILLENIQEEIIKEAIKQRYEVIGVEPEKLEEARRQVKRQEKKIMLDKILSE